MLSKKYYLSILPFLFFLPSVTGIGQNLCVLNFFGTVVDENQNKLIGAAVILVPLKKGVSTDADGAFRISHICPGDYWVTIQFLGYKTLQQKVTINTSSQAYNFSLKAESFMMDELIVEAHGKPTTASQNYSVLSAKQLEEKQDKSLGELLADITGVNSIQTGPTIFKPVIHGVHSQRILVLNNGLLHQGQQWGAEHALEIDPFSTSRIIVIKDAGAIKYGPGSLGGVVVVTPEDLPDTPGSGGKFSLIGASNGRRGTVAGMMEGSISKVKGLSWRAQGKAIQSGDFHTPKYILSNTGYTEYDYSTTVGFHRNKLGFEASYSSFRTELGILRGSSISSLNDLERALENEPPQFTRDFTYDIHTPKQDVIHNVLKVSGHYQDSSTQYRVQYGLQVNRRKEFDIRRGALNNLPVLNLRLLSHSVDVEIEHSKKQWHSRCLGSNGLLQYNENIPGIQRIPFIPNYTHQSIGIYDIESFQIGKTLLEVGLRYDYKYYDVAGRDYRNELFRSSMSFHGFSSTIGVHHPVGRHAFIISNLGSTWRPPTMAELYSLGVHQSAAAIEYGLLIDRETTGIINIDKINFKNEQAIKWVSTFQYHKGRFTSELSGYVNYIFHYTYLRPEGVTQNIRGVYPYFRHTQTDASFLGMDLWGGYTIHSSIRLNMKIALLYATDERNQDYLVSIPSNRFEFSTRYEKHQWHKLKKLFAEIKATYVARQYRTPRTISVRALNETSTNGIDLFENNTTNFDFLDSPDGYFLAECVGGVSIPIKDFEFNIKFSVTNLLNTKYREYTNRMRYYAAEMGRNFTLILQYVF